MKLKELKDYVERAIEEFGDINVVIDTEAKKFLTHIVELKEIYVESNPTSEKMDFILFPSYSNTKFENINIKDFGLCNC